MTNLEKGKKIERRIDEMSKSMVKREERGQYHIHIMCFFASNFGLSADYRSKPITNLLSFYCSCKSTIQRFNPMLITLLLLFTISFLILHFFFLFFLQVFNHFFLHNNIFVFIHTLM